MESKAVTLNLETKNVMVNLETDEIIELWTTEGIVKVRIADIKQVMPDDLIRVEFRRVED